MKSYKEALAEKNRIEKKLSAYDFSIKSLIYISHLEGTTLVYKNAFALKYDDWYLVFTEHHGSFVYHKDDACVWYFEGKRIKPHNKMKFATGD